MILVGDGEDIHEFFNSTLNFEEICGQQSFSFQLHQLLEPLLKDLEEEKLLVFVCRKDKISILCQINLRILYFHISRIQRILRDISANGTNQRDYASFFTRWFL